MGWKELGTLEITALPTIEEEHWMPFDESSDAILVSGGNTGALSHQFQRSEFAERLPGLLSRGGSTLGSVPAARWQPQPRTTTRRAWNGKASTTTSTGRTRPGARA